MNQENLSKILKVTDKVVGPKSVFQNKDFTFIKQIKVSFQPWTWILKLITLILLLNIMILLFEKKILFHYLNLILIYFGLIFLFLIVLASGYQLPERITLNLLAASAPLIIFNLVSDKINITKYRLSYILLIFILLVFGSWDYLNRFSVETHARINFYSERIEYATKQKSFISKLPDSYVLLGSSSVFKSDWQFPYSKYEPFDPNKRISYLGWHNLSPMWINFMKELGIDGNNFPDSYFDSTLVYVESSENFEFLKNYLNNLNYRLEVTDLGQFGPSDYKMYKLKLI